MSWQKSASCYVLFALGVLTFASTTLAVWQHFSPVPLGDSWDGTIGFYMRAMQDPWHAFFEQHNEHRLTFSRLIFFADVRYFGGRNVLSLVANLVLAGTVAAGFFRIAIHHRGTLSREGRLGLVGLVLVFAFSWIQKENFTWGFQSQWFAVYLFALLAFHAIDLSAEAQARGEHRKSSVWCMAAATSAWFAAYSMSSGVLVFPVLVFQSIYWRLKPRELLLLTTVTAAVWFAYFIDWKIPASSGNLTTGLSQHPLIAFRYVLLYLGAPVFHTTLRPAGSYVAGALVLAALAVNCFKAFLPDRQRPQGVALLVFALFIVGNALLTASGRLWFGLGSALSSRYTTASLASWLALIIFAALNSRTARQRSHMVIVAMLAIMLVASDQRFTLQTDRGETYMKLVAGLALRAHIYDPAITRSVYPFPDALTLIAREAEAARLSIFASDQIDYLVPPNSVITTLACEGEIDQISPTVTSDMYQATGWIYLPAGNDVPRTVVVTDEAGATLGTGVSGAERDDIRDIYGRGAKNSGWTAFFKTPAHGGIRINGHTPAGTYCTLKNEKRMPPSQPSAAQ